MDEPKHFRLGSSKFYLGMEYEINMHKVHILSLQ